MRRYVLMATVLGMAAWLSTSPALASQCPKLIAEIERETGNRLDNAAYEAKRKAAEAAKLHAEGKHAESEKVAKEALTLLGK